MEKIVRTPAEVEAVMNRARDLSYRASDAGESDETADAVYHVTQWLLGHADEDPQKHLLEDEPDYDE